MNKGELGQEQINWKIIADKEKELCRAHPCGKSDKKKVRVLRGFFPPSSRVIGLNNLVKK